MLTQTRLALAWVVVFGLISGCGTGTAPVPATSAPERAKAPIAGDSPGSDDSSLGDPIAKSSGVAPATNPDAGDTDEPVDLEKAIDDARRTGWRYARELIVSMK